MITPRAAGGYGHGRAVGRRRPPRLHATLTGERQGYYVDFGSMAALAKVCTSAFFHDGTYSTFRGTHPRPPGRPGHPRLAVRRRACRTTTRWATARPATGSRTLSARPAAHRRRAAAHLAVHPDALDGRGVGRATPLAVLHLAPAAGAGARPPAAAASTSSPQHGWDARRMIDPQDPTRPRAQLDWSEPGPSRTPSCSLYRELIALRSAARSCATPGWMLGRRASTRTPADWCSPGVAAGRGESERAAGHRCVMASPLRFCWRPGRPPQRRTPCG